MGYNWNKSLINSFLSKYSSEIKDGSSMGKPKNGVSNIGVNSLELILQNIGIVFSFK